MNTHISKAGKIHAVMFFGILFAAMALAAQTAPENKTPDHQHQYIAAEHLLDGTSFDYFYKAGGGLKIAFAEGKLQYEWISGPRKGNHAENIPYQSRRIGNEVYLVNWHQPDKPDFVSLIIDLKQSRLYSSAILRYGTGKEMIHFKEASIKNVKQAQK